MRWVDPFVGLVSRVMSPFVSLVSRVPARVQFKLLTAFLAIAMLLIMVGAVGLQVLSGVYQRAEELVKLQRKIEAYRQVQHDTTTQLYSVAPPTTERCRARFASSTSSATMSTACSLLQKTRWSCLAGFGRTMNDSLKS